MATFAETFERKEVKYLLSAGQRNELLKTLEQHMSDDEFGKSQVTSLYLDTVDHDLICRSLEKPRYKEKIRLRSYSSCHDDVTAGMAWTKPFLQNGWFVGCDSEDFGSLQDMATAVMGVNLDSHATSAGRKEVFLEIKKKYDGVVYKRRVRVSAAAAKAFLSGVDYQRACAAYPLSNPQHAAESVSGRSLQIAREIEAFCHADGRSKLMPSMVICCTRSAYRLNPAARQVEAPANLGMAENWTGNQNCQDLRITFDRDIVYGDLTHQFRGGHSKRSVELKPLLAEGESVMEIKTCGAMPLWLTSALSSLDIKPTSFSKYGRAYQTVQAKDAFAQMKRQQQVQEEQLLSQSPDSTAAIALDALRNRRRVTDDDRASRKRSSWLNRLRRRAASI